MVLDPFCGCGTTVAAAQGLNRKWVGIDITHLAINLIRHRLQEEYGEDVLKAFRVIGEPTSLDDAKQLAAEDPYQFQWWALGLVGARPTHEKKGADQGIDGRIFFHEDQADSETQQVILSVKAGGTSSPHLRDLVGVLDREKAQIGVLLSLRPASSAMKKEAASSGFYESPWGKHARIQILTIEDLLSGKRIDMPPLRQGAPTGKKARQANHPEYQEPSLFQEE